MCCRFTITVAKGTIERMFGEVFYTANFKHYYEPT